MLLRLVLLIVLILAPFTAEASGVQKSLGTFGAWQTFSYNDGGQPVCYMVKPAHFPKGKNKKFMRGAAYIMITHRPIENSKNVFSYTSGYTFRPATDVTVRVGKNSFDLFTQKDTAWSRDTKTDRLLAAAIRTNTSLKITGVPAQNVSPVTDTLDLRGANAAYQAIGKACGLTEDRPQTTGIRKKKPDIKKRKH